MIDLTVKMVGIERVSTGLAQMSDGILVQIKNTLARLAIMLQASVRDDYLNLPRPQPPHPQGLSRLTGTLSRSINFETSQPAPGFMVATVGTNVLYGRFWELGFTGTQFVSPHVRHIKNVMGKISVGGGKMSRRKIASGIAYVKGHTRDVNQEPRAFLGPALDDLRPQIREDLLRALVDAGTRAKRGR